MNNKTPMEFTNMGFVGLMDQVVQEAFKITDEQLTLLFDSASEKEMKTMMRGLCFYDKCSSFTQKRKALEVKFKYLT